MRISECFAVFSLPHTASKAEVKSQYRQLVKKYHPDSHSGYRSREKFEMVQQAYETIQAFFEFRETFQSEDIVVTDERLERIKRARQKQRERKEREEKKLRDAIRSFRLSKNYSISRFLAIIACCVGIFVVIDFNAPSIIEWEPIQGIEHLDYHDNATLFIQDRMIPITPEQNFILHYHHYVLVETTQYFKQIKNLYVPDGEHHIRMVVASFYNTAILYFFALCMLGMLMFVIKRNTVQYYFLIRYYNLYVLPLLLMYILFGNARVFYVLGFF